MIVLQYSHESQHDYLSVCLAVSHLHYYKRKLNFHMSIHIPKLSFEFFFGQFGKKTAILKRLQIDLKANKSCAQLEMKMNFSHEVHIFNYLKSFS